MKDNRPVYLNLIKIHLPIPGVVSFAHRVSGVLLFLFLPYAIYLLAQSVQSADSFAVVKQLLQQPLLVLVQLLVLWSIAHHFFAGIRFLLIDAEIGVDKGHARVGAWLVFLAEAITMLIIIFGVYL
jgi:succinate dehydrogenase / fumarate reductase cytochrome b subunit